MAELSRKLVGTAAFLMALGGSLHASAESAAEPEIVTASLEWVATAGCGSEGELVRAIMARSERILIESQSAAAAGGRRLRVEMRDTGSGVVTVLSLTQPNGRRSTRTLRAASCPEALDGAALVAAVSLDPTASLAAPTQAPRAPQTAAPAPHVCPRCDAVAAPKNEDAPHVEAAALLSFDAISGPAPGLMLGFGAAVMLGYERDSVLSPAVRLSFSHFARGGFAEAGGSAEFSLDAGSVELCPLRAQAGPLRVYPCLLRVAGGRLQASGSRTTAPETHGRPWWELGSSLVAEVVPTRSLVLGVSLAAGWPVLRDRFQFEPLEFYRVSGLAWTLSAGAGVRFP